MKRLGAWVVVAMIAALVAGCEKGKPIGTLLFDNWNIDGVENGGASPSVGFDLEVRVTSIVNYHWNDGLGQDPGTIAMRDEDGKTYGPWRTSGSEGQGGVPNAYWTARPNVILPAGIYTVIDSDPSTWAQNAGSGGYGMVRITGRVLR